MPTSRKKLIEVALPLDAINIASAREKSIRHGHPNPATVVGAVTAENGARGDLQPDGGRSLGASAAPGAFQFRGKYAG